MAKLIEQPGWVLLGLSCSFEIQGRSSKSVSRATEFIPTRLDVLLDGQLLGLDPSIHTVYVPFLDAFFLHEVLCSLPDGKHTSAIPGVGVYPLERVVSLSVSLALTPKLQYQPRNDEFLILLPTAHRTVVGVRKGSLHGEVMVGC